MFRPEVCRRLAHYVYRLVDPRDGTTFYVGKGVNNRVFHHAAGKIDDDGALHLKLTTIADIHASGHAVAHWIHRHGLDEATAFHVESALIDAYTTLTNRHRGHGADAFGNVTTDDLVLRYQAEPAEWHDPMLLVGIRLTGDTLSTYDAARYAWPLSADKLRNIRYVLAVRDQRIVEVFVPLEWRSATLENFPAAKLAMPGRTGFVGAVAPVEIRDRYVGRRLPDGFKLSQVGIRYVGMAPSNR